MAQTTIMESCLLCLDLRSDKLNCISTDSKKWQELNIANTVEKHFWPLNTIQFNSFICSPCWRLVYDFHKFYLRVEEAHMKLIVNGEKQNVEDYCIQKLEVNQEVIADVNIKNEPLELCEDLESNVNESYTGSVISGTSRKRKRSEEDLNNELEDLNDNDSESVSDIDESIDVYSHLDTNSSENDGINADDENDKLIVDYLKQINCNICNIQLESFSAVRKHFLEVHQEKGYLLCCNRKFFRRKYLVDHIHCHLNPNYFRCAPCDKIFSGRKLLEKHKCRSHGLGQITKRHSCDICGKYFFKEQNLKMHKLSHVPAAEKNSWNERNEFLSETIYEEPFVENTQEFNANQFIVPDISHNMRTDFNEHNLHSKTLTLKENVVKNKDIFAVLNKIAQGQEEFKTWLRKLQHNQTKILHNNSILSNGQAAILNNQRQIANTMDKFVTSIEGEPDIMTHSELLTECKKSIKRVEESVYRNAAETNDKSINAIARMLPLQTLEAVQELEQKLETPDFTHAMMSYLHKVKGTSEDVSSVIRVLFTDDLLEKFNWKGRWEKQALGKLTLFNKTLRDVFQQQHAFEFEKSVKKAIERSHHRVNQKKYVKKEK